MINVSCIDRWTQLLSDWRVRVYLNSLAWILNTKIIPVEGPLRKGSHYTEKLHWDVVNITQKVILGYDISTE